MRVLQVTLLVACLGASWAVPTNQNDVQTSPIDLDKVDWSKYLHCPADVKDKFYRNPYDCSRFYRCYQQGEFHRLDTMKCPQGQYFDENVVTCLPVEQYKERNGDCKNKSLPDDKPDDHKPDHHWGHHHRHRHHHRRFPHRHRHSHHERRHEHGEHHHRHNPHHEERHEHRHHPDHERRHHKNPDHGRHHQKPDHGEHHHRHNPDYERHHEHHQKPDFHRRHEEERKERQENDILNDALKH